jgi:hypothetical protein
VSDGDVPVDSVEIYDTPERPFRTLTDNDAHGDTLHVEVRGFHFTVPVTRLERVAGARNHLAVAYRDGDVIVDGVVEAVQATASGAVVNVVPPNFEYVNDYNETMNGD